MGKIALGAAVLAAALVLLLGLAGKAGAILPAGENPGYVSRLFDGSRVHRVDIQVEDWEAFLASAPEEEYIPATVEIDGEAFRQVGLRAKGNNSLRLTEEYGLSRYSLKLEFDHYTDGSYHGLDKLSLDASFQDNSYLKTWLAFDIMEFLGVPTPLRSFVWVTVNGQPWGLNRSHGGVQVLPPYARSKKSEWYKGTAEFWGKPRSALQTGLPLPGRGERRRPPALHHRRARGLPGHLRKRQTGPLPGRPAAAGGLPENPKQRRGFGNGSGRGASAAVLCGPGVRHELGQLPGPHRPQLPALRGGGQTLHAALGLQPGLWHLCLGHDRPHHGPKCFTKLSHSHPLGST